MASAPLALTTLSSIKALLDRGNATRQDTEFNALILAVSRTIQRHLRRFTQREARTVLYDVRHAQRVFLLKGFGVVDGPLISISSIKHSTSRDFASATAFTTSEYTVDDVKGHLRLERSIVQGRHVLQVVYTGGIADNTADIETYAPDIKLAADYAIKEWVDSIPRNSLDRHSISEQGGSTNYQALKLPPVSVELLQAYVRKRV